MKYLALDLGTSFLKGAVLDLEAAEVSHVARRPFPSDVAGLPARHVEVEPAAIAQATQALLDQLAALAPDAKGVVVTSQMHGIVLTDAKGKALSNAVTWQDQRILDSADDGVGSYFDHLKEQLSPSVIAATGNGLKPSLPLCTLAWWANKDSLSFLSSKLARQKVNLPDGAIPASLPDYVLSTMAHSSPVTEPTMAASMGMLDLTTGDWHWDMLRELGLDRLSWPPVVNFKEPSYILTIGGRQLPCYAPVGDHQCALVGALLAPEELSINIATGSQLGVIAPSFLPGIYESRPYFDSGYLQAITRIPAGRALNALVGLLTELAQAEGYTLHDPWATIAHAVDAILQTDLQMDVSFFASPVGERGEMANLSEENLRVGHLFRAAFQSMARNYVACAERLAPPQPWKRLVFSGGLAQRFEALRDEVASHFALPFRLCPTSEDTLLGLLALARVSAGMAPTVAASVAQLANEVGAKAQNNYSN